MSPATHPQRCGARDTVAQPVHADGDETDTRSRVEPGWSVVDSGALGTRRRRRREVHEGTVRDELGDSLRVAVSIPRHPETLTPPRRRADREARAHVA